MDKSNGLEIDIDRITKLDEITNNTDTNLNTDKVKYCLQDYRKKIKICKFNLFLLLLNSNRS